MTISRFLLYGLSFASSLIIVAFVPHNLSGEFLATYAASSLIGGIVIVLALGSRIATAAARYWVPLVASALCLISLVWPTPGISILYAGMLLMSDYLASQSGLTRLLLAYRAIMIVSALPFIFFPELFTGLILLRSVLCLIIVAVILVNGEKLNVLKIHQSFWYVGISHFAYFGTLFFLTTILPNNSMRVWYLGTQLGFGLFLKRFDFSIRGDAAPHRYIDHGILILATAIPLILMMHWFNIPALLAYFTGAFTLSRLKHFVR